MTMRITGEPEGAVKRYYAKRTPGLQHPGDSRPSMAAAYTRIASPGMRLLPSPKTNLKFTVASESAATISTVNAQISTGRIYMPAQSVLQSKYMSGPSPRTQPLLAQITPLHHQQIPAYSPGMRDFSADPLTQAQYRMHPPAADLISQSRRPRSAFNQPVRSHVYDSVLTAPQNTPIINLPRRITVVEPGLPLPRPISPNAPPSGLAHRNYNLPRHPPTHTLLPKQHTLATGTAAVVHESKPIPARHPRMLYRPPPKPVSAPRDEASAVDTPSPRTMPSDAAMKIMAEEQKWQDRIHKTYDSVNEVITSLEEAEWKQVLDRVRKRLGMLRVLQDVRRKKINQVIDCPEVALRSVRMTEAQIETKKKRWTYRDEGRWDRVIPRELLAVLPPLQPQTRARQSLVDGSTVHKTADLGQESTPPKKQSSFRQPKPPAKEHMPRKPPGHSLAIPVSLVMPLPKQYQPQPTKPPHEEQREQQKLPLPRTSSYTNDWLSTVAKIYKPHKKHDEPQDELQKNHDKVQKRHDRTEKHRSESQESGELTKTDDILKFLEKRQQQSQRYTSTDNLQLGTTINVSVTSVPSTTRESKRPHRKSSSDRRSF